MEKGRRKEAEEPRGTFGGQHQAPTHAPSGASPGTTPQLNQASTLHPHQPRGSTGTRRFALDLRNLVKSDSSRDNND